MRAAARTPTARDERRRVSERLAEAAGAAEVGRVPGMPSASPWQRSNAVWHRAGIDWSRAEAEPRPSRPASVPAPAAAAYPAAAYPAAPPQGPPAPPVASAPDDATPADAEPWGPPRRGRTLPDIPLRPVAIAVAAVVVLAVGAYILFGGGDGAPKKPVAGAVAADQLFATDPAATTSGRSHTLTGVVASGGTVVAIGSEQGGGYSRGQFLTSADGGRRWRLAQVRAAHGGDPPQGEYPQFVAGGTGAWTALGSTPAGTVAWTSRDARTWTRQAVTGAFGPGDTVNGMDRTGSGFVAVGTATVKDGTQAVIWTSGDGRAWTRLGADQLKAPSGGAAVRLREVTAHGATVLAHGTLRTTETVKKKKKTVRRTVETEAFWRSPDGGRSWAPVAIPQAQGSSGDVVAIVATQAGFFAAREASRTTGSKKSKKTVAYGVVFGSPDGQRWAPAGQLGTAGYARIGGLRGTDGGLAALVSVPGGKTAVMTSGDGKTWRRVGDLPAGRTLTGVALAPQGPVVTGRLDTGDAYLTVAGAGDVNLAAVPDAVHPERAVAAIAAGAGQTVAVGSTNGHAALWTSPNGSSWTRAKLPAPDGSGPQRLVDAVHGGQGWLAVGGSGSRALAFMSGDGNGWQPVSGGKVFGGPGNLAPAAAAANGAVYVVAGRQDGATAAAWYSTDLRNWAWSGNAGKGDLVGTKDAPKWISDVVAGPAGFVAVGGQTRNKTPQPALWTSPDGRKWALSAAPPALPQGTTTGSLTTVVARGGVLVASGAAGEYAFATVSADGGRTWQPAALPGAVKGAVLTAATATPHGFVLAGTSGSDVSLWTSPDGRAWHVSHPHGLGLDGPGVQRLDGMTVVGRNLLAVGFTGDYRRDGPTLWRTPAP
ncbi:MAG: hypothetical protein JWR24_2889 [Actinoallomurus sp.]|nr:hypothetical protein [Actinoallomurus sp.]